MHSRFKCLALISLTGLLLQVSINTGYVSAASEYSTVRPVARDAMGFSRDSGEARAVLAHNAHILELPERGTFAVAWFPKNYRDQFPRRTLFVLHGSGGNAYQGIYHQLAEAKKHGYGLVSLQWWLGEDRYLDAREIQQIVAEMMPYLISRYGVFPHMSGLETFSRSASISYEIAFWDKLSKQDFFRIVIAQSGGVPIMNPRPLMGKMTAHLALKEKAAEAAKLPQKPIPKPKPVPRKPASGASVAKVPEKPKPPEDVAILSGKALAGKRFFLYCGGQDEAWGAEMCENMHNAKRLIESQGAVVVKFIEDPAGTHGGMHNTPAYQQAATQAFLSSTVGKL